MIFELKAHNHEGLEEEDVDGDEIGGGEAENWRAKRERRVSLLLKVVWVLEQVLKLNCYWWVFRKIKSF